MITILIRVKTPYTVQPQLAPVLHVSNISQGSLMRVQLILPTQAHAYDFVAGVFFFSGKCLVVVSYCGAIGGSRPGRRFQVEAGIPYA